jgi:hypothetical protein
MKNTKALVPIGTIVIIIIVILASFGLWWWLTRDSDDCADVEYWDTAYGRRWRMDNGDTHPFVNRDDRAANINAKWRAEYINLDGDGRSWAYPTLQELEDAIDNWPNIRDEDLADIHHIIDCIQSGCSTCEGL